MRWVGVGGCPVDGSIPHRPTPGSSSHSPNLSQLSRISLCPQNSFLNSPRCRPPPGILFHDFQFSLIVYRLIKMKREKDKDKGTVTKLGEFILELKLVPWEHSSPAHNNLILINIAPLGNRHSLSAVMERSNVEYPLSCQRSLKTVFDFHFCLSLHCSSSSLCALSQDRVSP